MNVRTMRGCRRPIEPSQIGVRETYPVPQSLNRSNPQALNCTGYLQLAINRAGIQMKLRHHVQKVACLVMRRDGWTSARSQRTKPLQCGIQPYCRGSRVCVGAAASVPGSAAEPKNESFVSKKRAKRGDAGPVDTSAFARWYSQKMRKARRTHKKRPPGRRLGLTRFYRLAAAK